MFALIIAALSGTSTAPASDITANWADIYFAASPGGSRETSSVVTFTGGGTRQLLFEHDVLVGSVFVKADSEAYVAATSGYTKAVTTGQTVYIKYTIFGSTETATLTVKENTPGMGGSPLGLLLLLTKPTTKLIDTVTLTHVF